MLEKLCWPMILVATACMGQEGTQESGAPPARGGHTSAMETPPGSMPLPDELREQLEAALAAKAVDYEPRTELLTPDGRPRFTNRLILESSPYLLQHAHNPVDWFPWGPEAFERARREDKAIFLSIGYSTCHWCHVMERESFDDEAVARLMNEKFVCIKVDREQRPDLDEIYMTAVQLTTGRGGWPMSSFLTPDGKPFYGATYFPPDAFSNLMDQVEDAWRNRREDILRSADEIAARVAQVTAAFGEVSEVGPEAVQQAVSQILGRHDAELGGFGRAPKFPHESELLLLLETSLRPGSGQALPAVEKSLSAMAQGGIYDQVGGGFHRYSTDAHWRVPHFEKMLYNQAHLSRAYLEAYEITGKPAYARVARQTLDYVLREMTSAGGGFYSATDADSEDKEGEFFVWTAAEVHKVLAQKSPDLAALAVDLYGVTEGGNFEGKNILHLPLSLEEYAQSRNLTQPRLLEQVDEIRQELRQAREGRIHPLRDDKVLTAWNAMMITALCRGAEVLAEKRYLEAAVHAADFLWRHNRRDAGALWRLHLDGRSSTPAVQEDYAYLTEALLSLYDTTGQERWLERAKETADGMLARFWDEDRGGFFMSPAQGDTLLIARPKSPGDGAIPSGNSVAVRALVRLTARSGQAEYRHRAQQTLNAFSGYIKRSPASLSYMLMGADELLHGEAGARQYGASGFVAAHARLEAQDTPRGDDTLRLEVEVRLLPGWHINSSEPLQEELFPTVLELAESADDWRLGAVDYPPAEQVELGFQDEPLAVYQGTVTLSAGVTPQRRRPSSRDGEGASRILVARLKVQACNDRMCLAPEDILLEIPTSAG